MDFMLFRIVIEFPTFGHPPPISRLPSPGLIGFLLLSFFLFASENLSNEDLSLVCVITWCIWFATNSFIFENRPKTGVEILEEVGCYLYEFQNCLCIEMLPPAHESSAPDPRWILSDEESLKLNTGAAVEDTVMGARIVIRDSVDIVLGCASVLL
ncbi:hypothetical protein PanWU01x14_058050 [Parasponia andersonii]|uniref:Uncharacterized protein n=1 Tax=Parasponia andersonii TaxID=3476 RepID=A0A2P5DJ29_PARAD|nr:hypothetical protein PanWU01x14_058050 [Parasponia andersonii]